MHTMDKNTFAHFFLCSIGSFTHKIRPSWVWAYFGDFVVINYDQKPVIQPYRVAISSGLP